MSQQMMRGNTEHGTPGQYQYGSPSQRNVALKHYQRI
jgi:hypothetical protein